MKKYTIHCTTEQTRKALELGAPIDTEAFVNDSRPHTTASNPKRHDFIVNCVIPTAEQMIGWLDEKLCITTFDIVHYPRCGYGFSITYENSIIEHLQSEDCLLYRSRKEATIAAIDAALEYLSKNKK